MNKLLCHIITFLAAIFPSLKAEAQINTDQMVRVGINALYFEDYMLSIQYFNRVIESKPYLARPYLYRAIAKLNLEDYIGAEADATEAIDRNPFLADAWEVRGVARQNIGNSSDAIADYDQALSLLPENRNLMFNKAMAQEDTGNLDEALKSFDALIGAHPGYANAYTGRAKVKLSLNDTVSAVADLDRSIALDKNSPNAYILRAAIAMTSGTGSSRQNLEHALDDISEAIRLQPKVPGFFINRAYIRYHLDDYFGAMADYDYAITLDPTNPVAYFNRALLRAEVSDNDKAIADFSKVLEINPSDIPSRYNRAMLYRATRNYKSALADIDMVIEAFPDNPAPLFSRFEIYDMMGDKRHAMRDYDAALALAKKVDPKDMPHQGETDQRQNPPEDSETIFANRFKTLLTIENDIDEQQEFNNKSIRGKVQDRNINIEILPQFVASYYTSPTELAPSAYYMPEIDRINSSRQLRYMLSLTNALPQFSDADDISRHFSSVEYYTSLMSTHTPRAIDYFARGMDYFTIHDYDAAAGDFSKAIDIAPDFTLAYFMRAVAETALDTHHPAAATDETASPQVAIPQQASARMSAIRKIIADYDKVIELSPRNAFAYFNKGCIYAQNGDFTSALSAFSKAIELKHDFGEALYNRGYVYFRLGNKDAGVADLSAAGQLGIVPSYNLLKRMTR